eukprot:2760919-Ditylum_brightwellii.AAC.2
MRNYRGRTTEYSSNDIRMETPPSGEPRSLSDFIPDNSQRLSNCNGISRTLSFDLRDLIYSYAGITRGGDPNRRRSNSYSGVKSSWSDRDDQETKSHNMLKEKCRAYHLSDFLLRAENVPVQLHLVPLDAEIQSQVCGFSSKPATVH